MEICTKCNKPIKNKWYKVIVFSEGKEEEIYFCSWKCYSKITDNALKDFGDEIDKVMKEIEKKLK